MRDRLCFFLGQVSEKADRAEAAVLLERFLAKASGGLFREKWLYSSLNCVRKIICVYEKHV